ncbi:MAG: hypothetical protein GY754_12905 [bacterium]|nr:hypothetical protein [bacterium]
MKNDIENKRLSKIQEIAKERGGKCLSQRYINDMTKLEWQCARGHTWEATSNYIKRGSWCPECKIDDKLEELQEIAKERGGKCLSLKYVDINTNLNWQCAKGHIWETAPKYIKRGYWCPECSGKKKLTIKDMQELAKEKGGKCLSNEYLGGKIKLNWQCNKGHIWEATPDRIKNGFWCKECGNKKLRLEEMQRIANEQGGKCLSLKYINNMTKLEWQCARGHTWKANPMNIIRGHWCPECGGTKKLKIEDMQELAKEKGGTCLSLKYGNAKTKLEWRCKEGHVWKAHPNSIKNGHWCPECAQINRRKS